MRFLFRQLSYDLNANLLLRPALWLIACGLLSLGVPVVERRLLRPMPAFRPLLDFLSLEPGTAQTLLSTLAGSMMSVVLMTLVLIALLLQARGARRPS